MIQIPSQILRQYKTFIAHKVVPQQEQYYYIKWLRFYLDFCHKYTFRQEANKSLSAFMEKLIEKKQSERQRKQAHHSVTLYLELVLRSTEKAANDHQQGENITKNQPTPTRKETFCQENKQLGSVATQTHEPATVKNEVPFI